MKKENLLKTSLQILLFFSTIFASSQVVIYSEDFSEANNKGAVGPIPSIDVSGVDWSINISSAQLTTSTDWFQVINGVFEARDVDGDAIWLTPSVDISGHKNISFSLSAIEDGTMESTDIFLTEYRINGGTWTQAAINGSLKDDFISKTVSQTGLNGNTLEIRVTLKNNSNAEFHRFDDIMIRGTAISPEPFVTFNTSSSSVNETDSDVVTLDLAITLTNYDGSVTITPTVHNSSTAESGDYSIDLTPITFNANETLHIPLTVKDDTDSNNETIIVNFTVTSGTASIGTSQHTITITDDETPSIPSLIISEITDPGDVYQGRYVEIYNNGKSAVDLSSQQVYIVFQANGGNLFSRALSGTLNANEVMVIGNSSNISKHYGFSAEEDFGSINGNGNDGFFLYFGGDESSGTLFDSYGVLNIDGTGESWEYENSRAIRNNPISTSPNTTWTASEWTISSANLIDCTPGALENEFRYDGNWKPRDISNATTTNNVLITASITIAANLSINNFEVTNNATVTINSGIALLVNGTSSGNVTYQRNLATTNWYLMASPVSLATYNETWVTSNGIDNTSSSNNNVGIGSYDTMNNCWSYVSENPSVASGTFDNGIGYAIKKDMVGTVSFTGTLNTKDLNINLSTSGQRFNALGNPFTSFLATTSFLNNESAIGDTQNIWIWNQSLGINGDYEVKDASEAYILAPGQGFFIKSDSLGDRNFVFPAADRTLTGNTFQKTSKNVSSIQLWLKNDDSENYCIIRFMNNATKGFDIGKDGEMFESGSTKFSIYSQLVQNNKGKSYQLQSLPNLDFQDMVIPIGIISEANHFLSISANMTNLPKGLKIYLEDREKKTFTVLENAEKILTLTTKEAFFGTGRFYLHISPQVLNEQDLSNNRVSVFSVKKKLHINNLRNNKNQVSIYNYFGKKVANQLFMTFGNKSISLDKLSSGIYMVTLKSKTHFIYKKILIQ